MDIDTHDDSDSSLNSSPTPGNNQQSTQEASQGARENIEQVIEGEIRPTVVVREKHGARSFKNQPEAEDVVWEENGYFWVSSDGLVYISTDCFSGYVCAECKRSQNFPVLFARAYGDHKRVGRQHRGKVYLYIWDQRIKISDFRAVSDFREVRYNLLL